MNIFRSKILVQNLAKLICQFYRASKKTTKMHMYSRQENPYFYTLFMLFSFISLLSVMCFVSGDKDKHYIGAYPKKNDHFEDEDDFEENVEFKYVASSTHHIQTLFDLEKELVYRLLKGDFSEVFNKIERIRIDSILKNETGIPNLKEFQSNISSKDSESYVKHPINAFHLIKRTTLLWPRILLNYDGNREEKNSQTSTKPSIKAKEVKMLRTLTNFIIRKFPSKDDFYQGAAIGVMTVEKTYARNENSRLELANGILRDKTSNKTYKSIHQLSPDDCVIISNAAQRMLQLDRSVEWAKTALTQQKLHGSSLAEVKKLERNLERVKKYHDDTLISRGLGATVTENVPSGHPEAPIITAVRPYDEELEEIPSYKKSLKRFRKESEIATKLFTDIQPLDVGDGRFLDKSYKRLWYNMAPISRRLCNGDKSLRPRDKDINLKCILLHHTQVYLMLGPFKYEPLNDNPHVGMFRDFYSTKECESLIRFNGQKQENLESPEWRSIDFEGNPITNYFIDHRISKRHHIEDGDHHVASDASKRISHATQWMVHQRPGIASEHYHLINYGIGGNIDVHVDYWGRNRHPHPGRYNNPIFNFEKIPCLY